MSTRRRGRTTAVALAAAAAFTTPPAAAATTAADSPVTGWPARTHGCPPLPGRPGLRHRQAPPRGVQRPRAVAPAARPARRAPSGGRIRRRSHTRPPRPGRCDAHRPGQLSPAVTVTAPARITASRRSPPGRWTTSR
ncbi:hypothetical protein E0E62_16690 [Streptomyces sp. 16-176A]